MEPKSGFEFKVDEFIGYNWIFAENKDGEFINAHEDPEAAAKILKVSPEFLKVIDDAMTNMANELIASFKADLEDMHDLLS